MRIRPAFYYTLAALTVFLIGSTETVEAQQDSLPITLTLSTTDAVPISPLLYGVNYDWDQVPQSAFPSFTHAMTNVAHYTLARYPGGWNAEHYDWSTNSEDGKRAPDQPGVSPETFLAAVPLATFITPSAGAIADPTLIMSYAQESAALVARYGGRVPYWEIGNEWWLQGGAKENPAKRKINLRNYAALLAAVIPAMKAQNKSIQIFASGAWETPSDFSRMREIVGPKIWAQIDGVSVHSYCGNADPQSLCSSLPAHLAAVRQASGKQMLYASEWMVTADRSINDFGIDNANYTVQAIQDMAFAGVTLGAYWPPVKVLPQRILVSDHYDKSFATGIAFGWMSSYYRGQALHVSGPLPAVAARNGSLITVIIPSGDSGAHIVNIPLNATGLHSVASADVMYADSPHDPKEARNVHIVPLPVQLLTTSTGESYAQFRINPGTAGRGEDFEIARVTFE